MTDPHAKTKPTTNRRRRAEARPGEIVDAALECFLDNGFEATKIIDVAKRAGVAKGTVYIYFETKEQLFRAVVKQVTASNVNGVVAAASIPSGHIGEMLPGLLDRMVTTIGQSKAPAIVRLILREADRVPDLARIWFEDAASPLFAAFEKAIAEGQASGEVRAGDTRIHLVSILGPLVVSALFREIMGPVGLGSVDLRTVAGQHAETILNGLLIRPAEQSEAET
jgi:AcrR family transcriptional regulator